MPVLGGLGDPSAPVFPLPVLLGGGWVVLLGVCATVVLLDDGVTAGAGAAVLELVCRVVWVAAWETCRVCFARGCVVL